MSKSAEHAAEVEQTRRDPISKATLDILKRVGNQSEFSESWKSLPNAERSYLAGDIYNIIRDALKGIPTNDLIGELVSREGIACYPVKDNEKYLIQKADDDGPVAPLEVYHGPVTIITVDGES